MELDPGFVVFFAPEATLQAVVQCPNSLVQAPAVGTAMDAMKNWFRATVANFINCPLNDVVPHVPANLLVCRVNTAVWKIL